MLNVRLRRGVREYSWEPPEKDFVACAPAKNKSIILILKPVAAAGGNRFSLLGRVKDQGTGGRKEGSQKRCFPKGTKEKKKGERKKLGGSLKTRRASRGWKDGRGTGRRINERNRKGRMSEKYTVPNKLILVQRLPEHESPSK